MEIVALDEGELTVATDIRETPGANPDFASPMEVRTLVKPVVNALAILRYLSRGNASTATRIARELKINTSTCFNILRTLAGESVVLFDEVTKTYKVGPGMLQLVSTVMSDDNRLLAAKPMLQAFAREQQATLCVWRRTSPLRNVLVSVEYSEGAVRIHLPIGQSLPTLLGSTGRSMALHLGLTKREVRAEFNKLRWFSAPDFEDFWKEATEAHARGWAIDAGHFTAGVVTVSAPVVNASGQISFSLTALVFKGQSDAAGLTRMGEELAQTAQKLSTILY